MQPPRGMHDLLPETYKVHKFIEDVALEVGQRYGFEAMATPLVESVEVFCRSLGDVSDIVTKEMYDLVQKGSEKLVIRPENTAGIARAIISNGLTQSLPIKFIAYGPMLRYERPQKGRTRQFHQISAELFGIAEPIADVEIIAMAYDFLQAIGLGNRVTLELNTLGDMESRDAYRRALVEYLSQHKDKLSKESLVRLEKNPLRILDSKDEGDKELVTEAPQLSEYLNTASQSMFTQVTEGLEVLEIPFRLNPHLVRGLDYYCHVAFEFTTNELGSQSAVLAGGRYDGLVETLGGPHIPGIGWACGVDRLALLIELPQEKTHIVAIVTGEEASRLEGIRLAHMLRQAGIQVETIVGGNFGKKLKKANKLGASYALILGSEEFNKQEATMKNLAEGSQESVPFDGIVSYLQKEML